MTDDRRDELDLCLRRADRRAAVTAISILVYALIVPYLIAWLCPEPPWYGKVLIGLAWIVGFGFLLVRTDRWTESVWDDYWRRW